MSEIKPVAWTSPSQIALARDKPGNNVIMWGEPLPYHYDIALCRHDEAMAEIERLRAKNERLQRLFTHAVENLDVCLHHLSEARNKALDEAAAWHDTKAHEYTNQIAENDAYIARSGRLSSASRANEYCDDQRSTHRRAAAAIRALKVKP